jgi:hypothetical protein
MAYIYVFDKRLHGSRSLFDLLLGHTAYDLTGTTSDSGNEYVGELLVVRSFIEGLDNYSLFSGVTSSENDYYLSTLCT